MDNAYDQERLVRACEFMDRLGIKKSKFYQAIRDGLLPKPVALTKTSKAWPEIQVRNTIEAIRLGQLSL